MRCCSWAASWLSSGSVTIGNFLPLHYMSFPVQRLAPPRKGVPHISLVFGEMWDSTALTPKLPTPNQQFKVNTRYSPFRVRAKLPFVLHQVLLVRFGCVLLFRVLNFQ